MVDFFKFTEQVNLLHPTALLAMKFTPEISDTRHNIQRKMRKSYHWRKDEFKRKPSSIYIFTSYHPPNVKMDLINKKPWVSYELLWGSISDFKKGLMDRGWPHNFEIKIAISSKTHRRKAALLKQNNKEEKEILPFVTQYKPLVSIIKETLM